MSCSVRHQPGQQFSIAARAKTWLGPQHLGRIEPHQKTGPKGGQDFHNALHNHSNHCSPLDNFPYNQLVNWFLFPNQSSDRHRSKLFSTHSVTQQQKKVLLLHQNDLGFLDLFCQCWYSNNKHSPIHHNFYGWDSNHQKLGWFIIAISP